MLPPEILNQIQQHGLSVVLDNITEREEQARAELLYWKYIRHQLEAQIAAPIDELSEIAEAAFANH